MTALQEPDGAVVVRIEASTPLNTPDVLVGFPFGLEVSAARRLIADGTLPAAKIGRKLYAKQSDVVALVDKLRVEPHRHRDPEKVGDAYAALVDAARRPR